VSGPADVARVVVCEDSRTYAEGLRRFLEEDPGIRVVGSCGSAEQLLKSLPALAPDLVVLDLELPGLGGVDAVRHIMRRSPLPILVLSAHAQRGSSAAAAALGAGALEARPKSDVRLREIRSPAAAAFRWRIRRLARARLDASPPPRSPVASAPGSARLHRAAIVGICASAGGPPAVKRVLAAIPGDFPLPILVVQHMAAGFIDGLATWLDQHVALPVRLARDGAPATAGVWLAPDHVHLVADSRLRMRLEPEPSAMRHRPSGDMLLAGLAAAARERTVAVVLTGMGSDGAQGTAAVRAAGGLTIAQDEPTSAIYGMPRAALERGAELVLPPEQIGAVLAGLSRARVS
jgi:two-component system chemotaxis response regulator CheB